MAASEEDLRLTTNLKSFKDVSKLGKVKLKQICKNLGVDIEKSFGKKALINIVCNTLGISTSGEGRHLLFEDTFDCRPPEVKRLEEKLAINPAANGRGNCKGIFAWCWIQPNRCEKVQDPSSLAAQTGNSLSKVSNKLKCPFIEERN